ncbi:MAG: hypothetical protein ACYDCK_10995 [Thermoplasmatota archaeon]
MAKLVEKVYALSLLLFGPALALSLFAFGNQDGKTGLIALVVGIALIITAVATRAQMRSA